MPGLDPGIHAPAWEGCGAFWIAGSSPAMTSPDRRLPMPIVQTRRRFLTTLSLAGAAGLVGTPPALAAEGPLETTAIRLGRQPTICVAPQFVAEELLRAEGFTD